MSEVHFKTNIQLKNIIGKDLITDDNVAVLELVKNSYDAGSKIVELHFQNVVNNDDLDENRGGRRLSGIMVCDTGCGIDHDGLLNKWLNIAYSEKKEKTQLNGRWQAGNKGVGRFSCDRLGKILTIYTKTCNQPCLKMTIDWRLFEDENAQNIEIQNINFSVSEVSIQEVMMLTGWSSFENGTILDIRLLRERWTPEKILRLKRDLEKFINPNSSFISESFKIDIIADEYRVYDTKQNIDSYKINGTVKNQIFDKLDFRTTSIVSFIDSEGKYIVTELQDRGRKVFTLRESNIYPHLRDVKMTVYYLNPYSKRYFRQQTGFGSADFGSIFLFINGFRIPPYGDQGDDWLAIEKRKSLGYKRYLSTREVVGRIEITDSRGDFMTITSRTGVVNNDAFWELAREGAPYGFFYKGFRRLERFVVEGIAWDMTPDKVPEDGSFEGVERYKIDDFSRDKQILSVIRQIIDIDDSAIDRLSINEEFINEILDSQITEATSNIDGVVNGLSEMTDNATPEIIARYREKLHENSHELDKLLTIVRKLAPEQTDLSRLVHLEAEISRRDKELIIKEKQLTEEFAERARIEREKAELEKRLSIEKEKNTYLLTSSRSMSEDAKGMVHTIKIIAGDIKSLSLNAYNDYKAGRRTNKDFESVLGQIVFQSDKAIKISKLITRANFKAESENKIVNIIAYIGQYLSIYKDIVGNSNINIETRFNIETYIKKISVLDIAVILDNFISNAQKAHAENFLIEASQTEDNKLLLSVSDDGDGLDHSFDDVEDSIFDLGVTTTDGSGIGLHTVRNVVESWGGSVRFVGNQINLKGANFEIIIP